MKVLKGSYLREREEDCNVEEYYETIKLIEKGSISDIYVVRKKNVGGSAWKEVDDASASSSLLSFFCCNMQSNKKNNQNNSSSSTSSPTTTPPMNNEGKETAPTPSQQTQDYPKPTSTKVYAMKQINKGLVNSEIMEELRNEINICKELDHPNILKLYEAFESPQSISIIMEYLTGGNLYARNPYSEKESASIVRKLLSAVCFMHDNNVVHRALAFENILFENTGTDAEIKLIDFGLSTKFMSKNQYFTEQVGKLYTVAPEVIEEEYTSKCDLWSVGVITYMLLCGSKPFWGRNTGETIVRIKYHKPKMNGREWHQVSDVAKDFVTKLLDKNPKRRYTALQAQYHPWLHENNDLSDHRPSEDLMNEGHDSILRYNSSGDFKKLALNVIAHQSSAEDVLEIRKLFDQYDTEKNGQITFHEFKEAMSNFDYSEEEIDDMFRSVDVDDNGLIYYNEFLASTLESQGQLAELRLAEAFDRLDSDGSGFISKEDLLSILGNEGSEEYINQLIDEVDYEKDGKISYQEFIIAFQGQKEKEIENVIGANVQGKDETLVKKIFPFL